MANTLQRLGQYGWERSGLKRIFQGEGPQTRPYTLNRRRIFILPTRHGMLFASTLLIMLLGAINYNNSLAYLLTFTLASLAIVSILHTYKNMSGLVFRAGGSPPVFAGQQASFEIHIDHTGKDTRFAIQLYAQTSTTTIVDILPQQTTSLSVSMPAMRRGLFKPGRFTIATRYPLGLFRAWSYVDLAMSSIIYPSPAPYSGPPLHASRQLASDGEQGRGADDFIGFRNYHPGDSLRHVHWKAVARDQGMFTKQFGGDRMEQLWLDWDMTTGRDLEARLRLLCRWILDAEANGQRYGLRMPATTIPLGQGEMHRHRCLMELAMFGIGHES